VTTRAVEHSLAELQAIKKRIATKVGEGPDAVYLPATDEAGNRVVLWQRDWVKQEKLAGSWAATSLGKAPLVATDERRRMVDAEDATASAALAAEPPGVVVRGSLPRPEPYNTPFVDWGFCHPLYCPYWRGPMAGGMRLDIMRDDASVGGCTVGFNMRSGGGAYNGWAWAITAGHCVAGKTNNINTQHDGWDVFHQHGLVERNAYPYDYAVINYLDGNVSGQWLEQYGSSRNRILKYCRNGGLDSDGSTPCGTQAIEVDEFITGYHDLGEIKNQWIVCATGSGASTANYPDSYDSGAGAGYLVGTRCGRVVSVDVGINTDICARAGDSGGPLFSELDHTAYGILEGSQQHRTGPCQQGELNNYSPISTILSDINWGSQALTPRLGVTMALILSPNG